jgi:hypothetical protein
MKVTLPPRFFLMVMRFLVQDFAMTLLLSGERCRAT